MSFAGDIPFFYYEKRTCKLFWFFCFDSRNTIVFLLMWYSIASYFTQLNKKRKISYKGNLAGFQDTWHRRGLSCTLNLQFYRYIIQNTKTPWHKLRRDKTVVSALGFWSQSTRAEVADNSYKSQSIASPSLYLTRQKPGKLYTTRVLGLLLEEYKQKHYKLGSKAWLKMTSGWRMLQAMVG